MPVIRLESPGSGLWSQMIWQQYPVTGLAHPCILRRDSCRVQPHESRAPFPFLGRGNVGTPPVADDTNLFMHGKSLGELETTANNTLKQLTQWMAANK